MKNAAGKTANAQAKRVLQAQVVVLADVHAQVLVLAALKHAQSAL
jgi:hypothetical protein